MRLISLENIIDETHSLAKTILSEDGQVLLRSGTKLTLSLVKRLKERGIPFVYIEDSLTEGIEVPDVISLETRQMALQKTSRLMFKLLSKKSRDFISPENFDIRDVVSEIINDIQAHPASMYNLVNMQSMDDYLFHHSVNVGILAIIMGTRMHYTKDRLVELGIGATLHDVGKTLIPLEILNKPGRLSDEEYEIMRQHPVHGFHILKEQFTIPLVSAHIAFQHHERWNGSGYPRGLVGKQQHEYARITAIADVYDALISKRSYRDSYLPHEALELLFGAGDYHYDYDLVKLFRDNIAIYPVGMSILLMDGRVAVISKENRITPQRPRVRVITDHERKPVKSSYEVDLNMDTDIFIRGVM